MPNLTYKSPRSAQEFSQRTLTNLGYFWDINRRAYYFCVAKNDKKIYNFDDPTEFGDDAAKAHMDDEEDMGVPHDLPEGDAVMQDAPHGDDHDTSFGTSFADTSFIMTMLQNIQLRQDERYVEDCCTYYSRLFS